MLFPAQTMVGPECESSVKPLANHPVIWPNHRMTVRRVLVRVSWLSVVWACGPATATYGSTDGSAESEPDLPNEVDPCDCEAGSTCVLWQSDGGCSLGCVPLPPSCGGAPSCDAACNWDLCGTASCAGEAAADDFGCLLEVPQTVVAWQCLQAFGPCNPWLEQDCPDTEKCQPIGDDWWTTSTCRAPAAESAAIGEPCNSEGTFSGEDNCQAHATCWDIDPQTNVGTCVALCGGAPHAPICPPGTACALADPMWAAFCLPVCDPLIDDCTTGQACIQMSETFACAPLDEQPVTNGEVCDAPNDCADGLVCVEASRLPSCAGERCCTAVCNLDAPNCSPEAPNCTPALTQSPAELAHVGLCSAI